MATQWTRHVDAAHACVERQRTLTRTEVRALDAFGRSIGSMQTGAGGRTGDRTHRTAGTGNDEGRAEAGRPTPIDDGATQTFVRDHRASSSHSAVLRAYEETVMAVPHYDEEFGDGPFRSLADEFGPEVASLVEGGGQLTPAVTGILVAAATQARRGRQQYLTMLDREATSLSTAMSVLRAAGRTFESVSNRQRTGSGGEFPDQSRELTEPSRELTEQSLELTEQSLELTEQSRELADRIAACERFVASRQSALFAQRRRMDRFGRTDEFNAYVYHSLPVTYPVLVDLLSAIDALAALHQEIERGP